MTEGPVSTVMPHGKWGTNQTVEIWCPECGAVLTTEIPSTESRQERDEVTFTQPCSSCGELVEWDATDVVKTVER